MYICINMHVRVQKESDNRASRILARQSGIVNDSWNIVHSGEEASTCQVRGREDAHLFVIWSKVPNFQCQPDCLDSSFLQRKIDDHGCVIRTHTPHESKFSNHTNGLGKCQNRQCRAVFGN